MKSVRFSMVSLMMLSALSLFGQKEIKYPFSDIPQELLTNSNAVFREDIITVEVVDLGKAKVYYKYAVTILNEKADHYAEVSLGYDKSQKTNLLNARSYDKTGLPINTIKAKDIIDYSAYDGFSIYSDNRTKSFDLRYPDYPYTVEVEYIDEYNGFLWFPGWVPINSFSVSSAKSSYKLISPVNYEIRYKEINMEPLAKIETADGKKIISWSFGSFPALEREPGMPYFQEVIPRILAAPSTFIYEGYAGSISDWKSFGLFQLKLNEGRNQLTPEITAKVKNMVNDQQTQVEKVATLYDYLQKNTRYVSISLGIGGWQPFPAGQVASSGYGDCKALSNYMKSMLDVAGINSYYTIIKAGDDETDIYSDFPSTQFNHAILCVPNEQDTIWLECTSQTNPFGYQGEFTGDRDALVVNENGGFIAHTTVYNQDDNRQDQYTNVVLNEVGYATISFSSKGTGLQYDHFQPVLELGENEQKKWLYDRLDIPSFELKTFKFDQKKKAIPELNATISAVISKYGSVSGKRLFFQPNVFNKINSIAIPQKERKYPLALTYPAIDTDTVNIIIPQGYHLEFVPAPVSIESPYGRYIAQVIPSENGLMYIRSFSLVKGTFAPEQYMDFVKFINKVAEVDKSKLVLVKAT